MVRKVALFALTFLLAGCSDFKDAAAGNPCHEPVTVFFGRNRDTGERLDETVIAPESAVLIKSVLADPDGDGRDTMEFAFDGQTPRDLTVAMDQWEETIGVVIPARYCPS